MERSTDHVEGFVQLLAREQRRLFLYIHSSLPNWADAEEVLQNTNLILWRKSDEFQPGSELYCWACRVAHFEILKFLEKRDRDQRLFSVEFADEMSREMLANTDLFDRRHEALQVCLGRLCAADRELILLRYADGATTQSVADQLKHH